MPFLPEILYTRFGDRLRTIRPGFSRTATDVSFLADAVEKCRGVVGFAIGRVSACSWLDVGA